MTSKAFQFSFPTLFFLPLLFFWRTKVSRLGRCVIKNSSSSSLRRNKVERWESFAVERLTLADSNRRGKQTDRSIWWTNERERVDFSRMLEDAQILTGAVRRFVESAFAKPGRKPRTLEKCRPIEPSLTLKNKLQDKLPSPGKWPPPSFFFVHF